MAYSTLGTAGAACARAVFEARVAESTAAAATVAVPITSRLLCFVAICFSSCERPILLKTKSQRVDDACQRAGEQHRKHADLEAEDRHGRGQRQHQRGHV